MSAAPATSGPPVRCCALVVGSTETNLHNLLPTLERDLQGYGMMMVAPPTPLRRETVNDALSAASRAEICLVVFERSVSPDEYGFLYSLGVFSPKPDEGTVLFLAANRSIELGPSFSNSFVVLSLDDESALRRLHSLATEILQSVRERRGLPLDATLARWRASWEHAQKLGEAVFIPSNLIRDSTPRRESSDPVPAQSKRQSPPAIEATERQSHPAIESSESFLRPLPVIESAEDTAAYANPPLPPSGPILYLSYAYEPATEQPIFDTARELRRRGVRAQIDRLGWVNPRPDATNEQRYRLAVEDSEWFVLFLTDFYLVRTTKQDWTGVKTDLRNIADRVLFDPWIRERIIPVAIGSAASLPDLRFPPIVQGLDRFLLPMFASDVAPTIMADTIHRAITDQPNARTRSVLIGPALDWPQSELARTILHHADWISQGSIRSEKRISVGAILLAMLHLGTNVSDTHHSATWLASHLPRSDSSVIRDFVAVYFPSWKTNDFGTDRAPKPRPTLPLSYNAYSLLYWARLLAERTGERGTGETRTSRPIHAAHLLAALLHRDAPWTENVEKAMLHVSLDPDAIRAALTRDLPDWHLEGQSADWQLGSVRVAGAAPFPAPASKQVPTTKKLSKSESSESEEQDTGASTSSSSLPAARRRSARWTAGASAASVSADDPRTGEDHLDITPDVEAFAKVLASWNLEPPLALGLFGDWGSGKTFFMKRLKKEIESLSKKARDAHTVSTIDHNGTLHQVKVPTLQRDEPYCKYIAQVEFNAWHYSEGDLWACLVDHIFTNLRITDEDSKSEIALRLKALLTQLQDLEAKREAQAKEVAQADEAVTVAKARAEQARLQLEQARTLYNALAVKDIWDVITQDPKLHDAAKRHLERVGINPQNLKNAQSIRAEIDRAKSLGSRAKHVFVYLFGQWKNPAAYVVFVIVFGVPAALFALSELNVLKNIETRIGAVVTAVLSIVAGVLPIYRAAAARVSDVLDTLDKPRLIAEAQRREALAAIESEITQLATQRDDAQKRQADTEREKIDVQKQVDSLSAGRLMADFLQSRAASNDYRSKLGTLALIRRDFERLADLMSSQRAELLIQKPSPPSPPHADDGTPESKKAQASKAQQELEQFRVNRVVLYIDDLDRCSPVQVVKVLQAIHLLLAFPLFVVVVGVDARWVHRSIAIHCKELLSADLAEEPIEPSDDSDEEEKGTDKRKHNGSSNSRHTKATSKKQIATPRDYLEKIFQVPFWLQPMSEDACKKLIEGIVRPTASKPAAPSATLPAANPAAARAATSSSAVSSSPTPSNASPSSAPAPVPTPTGPAAPLAPPSTPATASPSSTSTPQTSSTPMVSPSSPDPAATPSLTTLPSTTTVPTPLPSIPVTTRAIELDDLEIKWMQELAPVVGRSPRAVKRFVNCYRLFKAVLPEDRVADFLKQDTPESISYAQVSLFFLALIVGEPEIARDVLCGLQGIPADWKVAAALSRLGDHAGLSAPDASENIRAVGTALIKILQSPLGEAPLADIRWIIDRALRFSFHSASMASELASTKTATRV